MVRTTRFFVPNLLSHCRGELFSVFRSLRDVEGSKGEEWILSGIPARILWGSWAVYMQRESPAGWSPP
jgi:hypothetical protein